MSTFSASAKRSDIDHQFNGPCERLRDIERILANLPERLGEYDWVRGSSVNPRLATVAAFDGRYTIKLQKEVLPLPIRIARGTVFSVTVDDSDRERIRIEGSVVEAMYNRVDSLLKSAS